jgi:site-specific DNA-methyltransferase (adenine-specific)
VDLLIVDPPYNLTKDFNGSQFKQRDRTAYADWLDRWISQLKPVLKPQASAYFCADWATSTALYPVLEQHFTVRNRITWERKRGAVPKPTGRMPAKISGFAPSPTATPLTSTPLSSSAR